MPSKLRKAIGAVKDQTSISLAKVSSANTVNIEVPILKATSHDEVPIDNRYLNEILQLIASNKVYAALSAQAIGRRVTKTRNWIVALKSLMLVLRIFQDGDSHFPMEVLHAMRTGARILNLSNFRDDSNSSPWDFTAFVRTFALYLDERLDCFLSGKLHRLRRCNYSVIDGNNSSSHHLSHRRPGVTEPVRDMQPSTLIDRISFWQKLLDRSIATKPTGEAKTNKLVQTSLHAIVQESFDLYRDISDGLALLLDSFFHLNYQYCVNAFQACVRASKQFDELSEFYGLCKSIGVGRTSEYPSVQKISDELLETLQEFLKDQGSFPSHRSPPPSAQTLLLATAPMKLSVDQGFVSASTSSEQCDIYYCNEQSETSGLNSFCTSPGTEEFVDAVNGDEDEDNNDGDADKSKQNSVAAATESSHGMDFLSFDKWPSSSTKKDDQGKEEDEENSRERDDWEIVLLNSTVCKSPSEETTSTIKSNGSEFCLENLFDQNQYNNPFLQGDSFLSFTTTFPSTTGVNGTTAAPTFCATVAAGTDTVPPTFCAQNASNETTDKTSCCDRDDLFESFPIERQSDEDQQSESESFVREQQLWLEQQKKIIAKGIMS